MQAMPTDDLADRDGDATVAPASASVALSPERPVFISYGSKDAAMAEALCQGIEKAACACWIAPRDVAPGAFYADAIIRGINGARVFLVVLSDASVASPHVLREVERASSKGLTLLSLRLDSTALPPALEYFLSASHWLRGQREQPDTLLPLVIESVRRLLATGGPHPDGAQRPPAGSMGEPIRPGGFLLDTISSHAPAVPPSVAILPFADLSPLKDQEYLADGIADEIIDALAGVRGVKVIGRTSSFAFKGQSQDVRTIGTQLNVGYLVEGSVRCSGDRVRLSAQLVRVADGAQVWAQRFDRKVADTFEIQDDVGIAIARALEVSIPIGDQRTHRAWSNSEAYENFLRGRHQFNLLSRTGLQNALVLFERSFALEPTNSMPLVWLSAIYTMLADGFYAAASTYEKARDLALQATRLNPNEFGGYCMTAAVKTNYDWDWEGAREAIAKAEKLAPGHYFVSMCAGRLALFLGRLEEASQSLTQAIVLNPLYDLAHINYAIVLYSQGLLNEAEAAARSALRLNPNYLDSYFYLGSILIGRGACEEALHAMKQVNADGRRAAGMAIAYHALGRHEDSDIALSHLVEHQADRLAYAAAQVYAFRGEAKMAIVWLERAYTQRDVRLARVYVDPLMLKLKADPDYRAFLRKMQFPLLDGTMSIE